MTKKTYEYREDIESVVAKLLSKTPVKDAHSIHLPVVSSISNTLNNSADYKQLLSSLLKEKQKTEQPS
jgi:hypothetical protein